MYNQESNTSKIRVLAFPAFSNKKSNPYNALLYEHALNYNIVEILEFSIINLFSFRYDLVHIHWPERYLSSHYRSKALIFSGLLLFGLSIAKLLGKKVVWTVHNLRPHRIKYQILNNLFWSVYPKLVNATISLSEANKNILLSKKEFSHFKYNAVIYHGLYETVYANNITKTEARKALNLDNKDKVCLVLGQILPYKNIPVLINMFAGSQMKLIVAGRFESLSYYNEIKQIVGTNKNIILVNQFIDNDQIQLYLNASDLCVIPFKRIFNSGSVLLNATFKRPTLLKKSDNFIEYATLLNNNSLLFYENELNINIIESNIEEVVDDLPNNKLLEWDDIAKKTVELYQQLVK